MDGDFWASRVHSAKHFSMVHPARFNSDDLEDDDMRTCFPCPFCYMEIELHVLCTHLQEEHCFDLKNAVCPLCAGNLGKDVIGHFVGHHTSSLKRRKGPKKSGSWTGGSTKSLSTSGRVNDSAPDPLLSPFLCHTPPPPNPKRVQQDDCAGYNAVISNMKSSNPSPLDEGLEQHHEERKQKAAFVQQLMESMIF